VTFSVLTVHSASGDKRLRITSGNKARLPQDLQVFSFFIFYFFTGFEYSHRRGLLVRPDLLDYLLLKPNRSNFSILEKNFKFISWFMRKCRRFQCVVWVENCELALRRKYSGAQYRWAIFRDESGKVNTKYNKHCHKVRLAFFLNFYQPPVSILWSN